MNALKSYLKWRLSEPAAYRLLRPVLMRVRRLMPDNADLRKMLECLERTLADLWLYEREYERKRDGISLYLAGDLLAIKEAADVWECCSEKIRLECEKAEDANDPIGFKIGPVRIIVTARLLDLIKRIDGEDAMRAAKSRADNIVSRRNRGCAECGGRPQTRSASFCRTLPGR